MKPQHIAHTLYVTQAVYYWAFKCFDFDINTSQCTEFTHSCSYIVEGGFYFSRYVLCEQSSCQFKKRYFRCRIEFLMWSQIVWKIKTEKMDDDFHSKFQQEHFKSNFHSDFDDEFEKTVRTFETMRIVFFVFFGLFTSLIFAGICFAICFRICKGETYGDYRRRNRQILTNIPPPPPILSDSSKLILTQMTFLIINNFN